MKTSDRDYFQRVLQEQRDEILARAGHHVELDSASGTDDVRDFADYAAQRAELRVDDRISQSEFNLLEKIEFALRRLGEGTHANCAECGGEIAIDRLRAKPAVSLCVACQLGKEARAAASG
jgi:DnaK suppressor protein